MSSKVEFDYDSYFSKRYAAKLRALEFWSRRRITHGASVNSVNDFIKKKFEWIHNRYFEGYELEIDYTKVFVEEKFYSKIFNEFINQIKLGYENPISSTVGLIPQIKKEAERLGELNFKDLKGIVNEYSYYWAYRYYCEKIGGKSKRKTLLEKLGELLNEKEYIHEKDIQKLVLLFSKEKSNKIVWEKSLASLRYLIECFCKEYKYFDIPFSDRYQFIVNNFKPSGKNKNSKKERYDKKSVSTAQNISQKDKDIIGEILEKLRNTLD